MLLKPLSKIKQVGQDLYTAEDDFWKIYTFATEQKRLQNAFTKAGLELDKSKDTIDGEPVVEVNDTTPTQLFVSQPPSGQSDLEGY